MKIVTLDGHSGAGKSTQAQRLAEHYSELNIEQIGHIIWRFQYLTDELFSLAGFDYSLVHGLPEILRFGMLYRMMVSYGKRHERDLLIIDDFFLKDLRNSASRPCFGDKVRLFREMLTLDSGIEPVASFYIDVPYNECYTRTFYRDNEHDDTQISIDLDTNIMSDSDRHSTKRWVALSEQIPYLHIIDGTQSIDAVSKEIISIIEGKFNENNND